MHRLFVALPVGPAMRNHIAEWKKKHTTLPVQWTAERNLHATILPPFETEDVNDVKNSLRTLAGSIGSVSFVLEQIAIGPDALWAEGETPSPFIGLKRELERALHEHASEEPLRLHITLARFDPKEPPALKKIEGPVVWADIAQTFVLMETHRTSAGTEYEILETFIL